MNVNPLIAGTTSIEIVPNGDVTITADAVRLLRSKCWCGSICCNRCVAQPLMSRHICGSTATTCARSCNAAGRMLPRWWTQHVAC